ncbi:MAG: hypothetical protein WB611_15650 [Stellaceae bacterium]
MQTALFGGDQEISGHMHFAPGFARQWPFSPPVLDHQATEYSRAGGTARQLFEFCNAVEREQTNSISGSLGNRSLVLDRVPKGKPLSRNLQSLTDADLAGARQIEIGSKSSQGGNDLRSRIGFDGVIDLRHRHRPLRSRIPSANDIEVDDNAGRRRSSLGEVAIETRHWHFARKRGSLSRRH